MSEPVVGTAAGKVRGRAEDGVAVFLGVPYAAAPFGAHRFRAPAPPEPWDGVRDALAYGPTAPKRPYRPPLDRLLPDPSVPGDDCLNLNIWAPVDAAGLPVMVWIHGGSLKFGSSVPAIYDGTAFARDGVVLVSINYRLGVEGFCLFPDAPANLGLLDQVAALRWVRDNIAAFGGDPANVTVFGESAGAITIGALLRLPAAQGLFHRAVLQSGPPATVRPAVARRLTRKIARRLGVPATAAAFADVDREQLLDAQMAATSAGNPLLGGAGFGVVDFHDDAPGSTVDLMVGYNSEEYRLWFVPSGLVDRIGRLTFRLALAKFRISGRVARLYRAGRPAATPGELLGEMATDLLLRVPLNRLADRHGGRAYMYEFGWGTEVERLGACHALEIPFVFDTLKTADAVALTGTAAPQELADAMHAAWVSFARTGDPGWPAWDASRPVMTFGRGGLVHAPREHERAAWDARD